MAHPRQPQASHQAGRRRPVLERAVAVLGTLVTHELAYALSEVDAVSHQHMSLLWTIGVPLSFLGLAGFILWQLRNLGLRLTISSRHLALWVTSLFLVQEMVEAVVDGHGPAVVVTNVAVWLGLLIGPSVAWVIAFLLRRVVELATRLTERPARVWLRRVVSFHPGESIWSNKEERSISGPRAPPGVVYA